MSTWLKSQTRRIKQQTLQAVGVAKQTKDPIFDSHVARFTDTQDAFERVLDKFEAYERCLSALSKASSELNAEIHIFCAGSAKARGESVEHGRERHQSSPVPGASLTEPSYLDPQRSKRASSSNAIDEDVPSLLNVVNYIQAAHISIQYSVVDITRKVFREEVLNPLHSLSAQFDQINRKIKERQILMLDYDHFKRIEDNANAKGKLYGTSENAAKLSAAEKAAKDITRALKDQFQTLEARRATMLGPHVAAFVACEIHTFQRASAYLSPILTAYPEVAGPLARLSSESHQFHTRIRENRVNPRFALVTEAIETATEGKLPPTYIWGKDRVQTSGAIHDIHHTHRLRWSSHGLGKTSFHKLHSGVAPDTESVFRPSSVPRKSIHQTEGMGLVDMPVLPSTTSSTCSAEGSKDTANSGDRPPIQPPVRGCKSRRDRGFSRSQTAPNNAPTVPPPRNPANLQNIAMSHPSQPLPGLPPKPERSRESMRASEGREGSFSSPHRTRGFERSLSQPSHPPPIPTKFESPQSGNEAGSAPPDEKAE